MLVNVILYGMYTILSAYIESIRIKTSWGKITNVSKVISVLIAVIGFVLITWLGNIKSVFDIVIYAVNCILTRGILYDPALNLFRKKKIDYESSTTNSETDDVEEKLNWDFWKQRRVYIYSLLIVLSLYYLSKLL